MVSVISIGHGYVEPNRKEFLISSESDISGLPTSHTAGTAAPGFASPGSIAYTPDYQFIYTLGNDDVWHKV